MTAEDLRQAAGTLGVSPQRVAQVLHNAADLLDERGYDPTDYDAGALRFKEGCQLCEVGALAVGAGAANGHPQDWAHRDDEPEVRILVEACVLALHGPDVSFRDQADIPTQLSTWFDEGTDWRNLSQMEEAKPVAQARVTKAMRDMADELVAKLVLR